MPSGRWWSLGTSHTQTLIVPDSSAWVEYFRNSFKGGAVGIWHETYVIPAGKTETIYGNMPLVGLGRVNGVEPVNQRGETAAERLNH